MTQLDFLRHVCRALLQSQTPKVRPGPTGDAILDVRFDGIGHECLKGSKEGRCKMCAKNTYYRCEKCGAKLHQKYFFFFHKRE